MIGSGIFERMAAPYNRYGRNMSEEEETQVQEMGSQVRNHTQTLVTPWRFADVTCRPVSVKAPRQVQVTKRTAINNFLNPCEMRLEPVIIGCVTHRPSFASQISNAVQRSFLRVILCNKRLLDQDVLSACYEVFDNWKLDPIRHADACRIIVI